jgi:hypothetical protein
MTSLSVTAKRQVTLKRDLLQHLGVQPSERIDFDKLPDGELRVRAARPSGTIMSDLLIDPETLPSSRWVEEIDDLVGGISRRKSVISENNGYDVTWVVSNKMVFSRRALHALWELEQKYHLSSYVESSDKDRLIFKVISDTTR